MNPDLKEEPSAPPPWLTQQQIAERVQLYSPALVAELYTIAERQLQSEDRREAGLVAKATSLLGQSGLAITVAGAVVGMVSKDLGPKMTGWSSNLFLAAYLVVFGLGTAAAIYAMTVLLVRKDFKGVNEYAVFDEKQLRLSDAPVAAAQDRAETATTKVRAESDADSTAATRYKRWLIPHFWSIYQTHHEAHERRARRLQVGQLLFTGFVILVALLFFCLTAALLHSTPESPVEERKSVSNNENPPQVAPSQQQDQRQQPVAPAAVQEELPRPKVMGIPPGGKSFLGSDDRTGVIHFRNNPTDSGDQ